MTNNLGVSILSDTKLWKRLNAEWASEPSASVARFLATNILAVCAEASSRMKSFPSLHPQYTLHDDAHLLRVTEIMGLLVPSDVLVHQLNPVEIAFLILAAHFHDQGMVLEADELRVLESKSEFKLFRDNWIADHPNCRDIKQRARDARLPPEERDACRKLEHELDAALLTDYVRTTHGVRSQDFVHARYGNDKRLEICGTNLAAMLGRICKSHTLHASELTAANGFRYDEDIATFPVNTVYLALVLRLADILDFDRERTPDELYRTIHFTSPVSLREWSNHRSVDGWRIGSELIRFTINCERPEYHRAVLRFMDWIDHELQASQIALRQFPRQVERYQLPLPEKVSRERIKAKNDAYIYHDLEFSLSRDEVVKLLMGKELYGSPSLCIRELIQNALDALRHRKAIMKRDEKVEWDLGNVQLEHTVDSQGREVLRCSDNGVGMDEEIICRFLVRAGRSYYRSPAFEQERASFVAAGADFDPCSRFGIGFMSCFMLGDQITIRTRRYGGSRRGLGKPLVVEINGLNGLVVFRSGLDTQMAGTTVEITGRPKPAFLDRWMDRVKLVKTVYAFALACEFPIAARCLIPEIADSVEVPPGPLEPIHALQSAGLKKILCFDQSFSEIDHRLTGMIRTCFLADASGNPCLSNDEAAWHQPPGRDEPELKLANGAKVSMLGWLRSKTCLDGILVCGAQGRDMEERVIVGTSYPNRLSFGNDFAVLDVRGAIKPALTPARAPASGSRIDREPSWDRLQSLTDKAHGNLWAKLLRRFPDQIHAKIFWHLTTLYSVDPSKISAGVLWDYLFLPTLDSGGQFRWRRFSEIGSVPFDRSIGELFAADQNGLRVAGDSELNQWHDKNNTNVFQLWLRHVVTAMATAKICGDKVFLDFRQPKDRDSIPHERLDSEIFTVPRIALPFDSALSRTLFIEAPVALFNEDSGLVRIAWQSKYEVEKTDIQRFISSLVNCLCRPEVLKLIAKRDDKGPSDWRALKMLGHLHGALDWAEVSTDLRPPYSLWIEGVGAVQISDETFREWSHLDVPAVRDDY